MSLAAAAAKDTIGVQVDIISETHGEEEEAWASRTKGQQTMGGCKVAIKRVKASAAKVGRY
jgi:hypothetical protein